MRTFGSGLFKTTVAVVLVGHKQWYDRAQREQHYCIRHCCFRSIARSMLAVVLLESWRVLTRVRMAEPRGHRLITGYHWGQKALVVDRTNSSNVYAAVIGAECSRRQTVGLVGPMQLLDYGNLMFWLSLVTRQIRQFYMLERAAVLQEYDAFISKLNSSGQRIALLHLPGGSRDDFRKRYYVRLWRQYVDCGPNRFSNFPAVNAVKSRLVLILALMHLSPS